MPSAIDKNKADFSWMDKSKYVYINEVYHKASVEKTEDWSDAAAASAV